MRLNCFRAAGGHRLQSQDNNDNDSNLAPRSVSFNGDPRKKSRLLRRQGSDGSQISNTSSKSNDSISKLPPCKRQSDPKIEAMMMPVPHDPRPSRCLRLSHPKIYSSLVSDMKSSKGCRDWKNFDVFYADDVDMSVSAEDAARRKALDYEQKLHQLNCSFSSGESSTAVDMIG